MKQSIFALILVFASVIDAELFTSLEHMRVIMVAHQEIAAILKDFVANEKARLADLSEYFKTMGSNGRLDEAAFNEFISNPIAIYQTVKNFNRDTFSLKALLNNEDNVNASLRLVAPLTKVFPTDEDYDGAIAAILRLQETYNLDPKDFINDRILPGQKSPATRMSPGECFEIGVYCYNKERYGHASRWMTEALALLNAGVEDDLDRVSLYDYLAHSKYLTGQLVEAMELTEELLKLDPNHERARNNLKYYTEMVGKKNRRSHLRGDTGFEEEPTEKRVEEPTDEALTEFTDDAKALCRGEKVMPLKNAHKLTCDYARNNDPRLLLAPLKRETVHLDPWIMIYHGVISESDMEFVKTTALPKLARATTRSITTGDLATADYRITKTAWLPNDTDDDVLPRLLHGASAMTQLTMATVEDFQVANYGIGGHYATHYDFVVNDQDAYRLENEDGNRIATLIYYLSDVDAGGATIFPSIGLTLRPEKGSAVLWYNLLRNGDGDTTLDHAACPVLYGHKWVMNKWFHEAGNEFWHGCSTDKNARFQPEDIEKKPPTYHRFYGRFQR